MRRLARSKKYRQGSCDGPAKHFADHFSGHCFGFKARERLISFQSQCHLAPHAVQLTSSLLPSFCQYFFSLLATILNNRFFGGVPDGLRLKKYWQKLGNKLLVNWT